MLTIPDFAASKLDSKDRDRYYYGVNDIFRRIFFLLHRCFQVCRVVKNHRFLTYVWRLQPDVAEHILLEAPLLAVVLLDGLIWRSHKTKASAKSFSWNPTPFFPRALHSFLYMFPVSSFHLNLYSNLFCYNAIWSNLLLSCGLSVILNLCW